MVTGNRTDQQIETYSLQEELKKKKKDILPEGYIFDYAKNEFVPATQEQVAERESYYAQNSYVAPPGTPGKITPQEYDSQLSTLTKSLYPEKFQPGTSYGYAPEELPPLVLKQARESAIENIQTFAEDLNQRGTLQDRQAMLSLLGVQPEDIDQLLGTNREQQADQLVKQVLPGQDINSLTEMATTNPTAFIDQMRTEGSTEDKRTLLTTIGFTPDEIDQIMGVQTKVMNVNGIRKQVTIKADGSVTDLTGANVGTYDAATDTITHPKPIPTTEQFVEEYFKERGWNPDRKPLVLANDIKGLQEYDQRLIEASDKYKEQYGVTNWLRSGLAKLVSTIASSFWAKKYIQPTPEEPTGLEKGFAALDIAVFTPLGLIIKPLQSVFKAGKFADKAWDALKVTDKTKIAEAIGLDASVAGKAAKDLTAVEINKLSDGLIQATAETIKPGAKLPEVMNLPSTVVAPISKEGFAANIKLEKFAPEIQTDIKAFTDAHPEIVQAVRRGTVPLKETEANAEALINQVGGDPKRLIKKVGQAYSDTEIRAISGALSDVGNEINTLRKTLASPGGDSVQNTLKFAELLTKHNYLQLAAIASRAEAGRALGSLRMMQNALKSGENPVMDAVLKRIGGKEGYDKIIKAMEGLDWTNPVQVNNFIRNISQPKAFDYVNEIFVNSILSGPKTQVVNATTNMINTIMSPLERGVAATIEKGLAKIQGRQSERFFAEVPADAIGGLTAMPEGLRGFWQTLKTGISPTAISKYEFRPSAFSGKVGRVINLPVNTLEAADNLNYNINFRQAFNAEIVRLGKSAGLKGKELISYIADTKLNPPADLVKRASETAEYRLFRAEGSGMAEALYKFRNLEIPHTGGFAPLKYIIPFVRTPVNIAKYGLERSPLEFFNPKLLHALRAKDPAAADMLARAFIGSTLAGAIAWEFAQGKITGPTPSSQGAKDRFYREGKQPYSIKIGDKWYSYQRMEPFNTDFTLVALAVDAIEKDDATVDEKVMSALKAMGNNFVSQQYMSGIADMIDAIENPTSEGANLLQSAGQALLVPASSLTRTVAQGLDTTIREPEGFVQKLMAGIPILSENVPPRLNVFGEPSVRQTPFFSPINVSKEQDSLLNRELSDKEVNVGFVGESINGVKLTDEQQRQYQELAGPMVKAAILRVIESEDYAKLSKEDARQAILNAANKAKTQARVQMIQEGTIESAPGTLSEIDKIDSKLGSVIKENRSVFSIDKPIIYDTAKYLSELKGLVANVKSSEVKDKLAQAGIKAIETQKTVGEMRNTSLLSLNADPTKKDTYRQLYEQAQARNKLTDPAAIEAFDKDPYTKDWRLGQFSRRELELLDQYYASDKKKQAELREQYPLLTQNPQEEYWKSHSEENALQAVFGQEKVLTKAAYDKALKLIDEYDIPDSAVQGKLPPKEVAEDYFKLQDVSEKVGNQSWEAQLIKAKNPALTDWLGLTAPDTPIKSLELKVKNADIQRKYDALSDKESSAFLPDIKDATGKSPRDLAQEKMRKDNPKWVDDLRRIEAIENGGEAVAEKNVEYGKVVDQFKASSPEAKLFRVDNPDLEKWGTERKNGWEPIDQTKIPIWRIDVTFRDKDKAYQDILDANKDNIKKRDELAAKYLQADPNYRMARRQRDAYQLSNAETGQKFPETEIPNYVTFYELPSKGYRRERFLIDNPNFAKSLHDTSGIDLPDPKKVPSIKYDETYEANQANFDKLSGLSDFESKFYIEDTKQRDAARRQMLTDRQGNPTKFGVANLQLEAYRKFVPDERVPDYVGYYSLIGKGKPPNTDLWYEDDWYLQEHPDFYKEVYLGVLGNERKDYRKVPTRQVYAKYQQYQGIFGEVAKDAFRDKNRDLDAWLVTKFGYTPISEKKRRKTLTPTEKAKEGAFNQGKEWRDKLKEIEDILAGVK